MYKVIIAICYVIFNVLGIITLALAVNVNNPVCTVFCSGIIFAVGAMDGAAVALLDNNGKGK